SGGTFHPEVRAISAKGNIDLGDIPDGTTILPQYIASAAVAARANLSPSCCYWQRAVDRIDIHR
ncbi:MAG TPA: hypothetical protein VLB05_08190, partial [Dongiaceae bacterium]|nr:hypothetical protein [Dongiaceae bacterium]